jgi:hypothetical protein
MIDLLSSVQVLLREAAFDTRLVSVERTSVLRFEDDSLMGFTFVFESAREILNRWRTLEMVLLTKYAASFRAAGDKAWNVYSVFLCASTASSPAEEREIHWIEEDLEYTRKLAACGVETRDDLSRVLLPILPLQYQPQLFTEDTTARLNRRIQDIAPQAAGVYLDEEVSPAEVARLLGDSR